MGPSPVPSCSLPDQSPSGHMASSVILEQWPPSDPEAFPHLHTTLQCNLRKNHYLYGLLCRASLKYKYELFNGMLKQDWVDQCIKISGDKQLRALVEGKRKNVSPHEVSAQR